MSPLLRSLQDSVQLGGLRSLNRNEVKHLPSLSKTPNPTFLPLPLHRGQTLGNHPLMPTTQLSQAKSLQLSIVIRPFQPRLASFWLLCFLSEIIHRNFNRETTKIAVFTGTYHSICTNHSVLVCVDWNVQIVMGTKNKSDSTYSLLMWSQDLSQTWKQCLQY